MARLIDELRSARPHVIADVLERAVEHWSHIEDMMRRNAARGNNFVILAPEDRSPAARAICAAVAAKAEIEGFHVQRIVRQPDALSAAMGASPSAVVWRVSW